MSKKWSPFWDKQALLRTPYSQNYSCLLLYICFLEHNNVNYQKLFAHKRRENSFRNIEVHEAFISQQCSQSSDS